MKQEPLNFSAIDAILDRLGRSADRAVPVLQEVQRLFRHVPPQALTYIASVSDMTETQLYGVVTFYSQFRLEPLGETVVRVCHGTACHVAGADEVTKALEEGLGVSCGATSQDGKYTLEKVACLGCCSLAPVATVDGAVHGRLNRAKALRLAQDLEAS